ncbi:CoA-transferase subunit beta [Saliterribacillus persicus]|uniref:Glutaconate CoA-transferase subunit B n=1 Tax=Saliterribacillus persicus TaxID=930114 RepID=A0A368XXR4_9BACI|nr:CoA-transferase [Saliterribacillus persicus]RCW71926.1 glutaconate CoA-transferase subunit B [Saliterribacillus persicus]
MSTDYRISDLMTCVIANLLKDRETVFHGVSSQLPMVAMHLAKNMHAPNLVHLNIPGGVNPSSIKQSSFSSAGADLVDKSESYFPLDEIFDLSMRGKLDVAFLGGIQFDINGNVNASVIGDYNKPKVRLPGGAGSAVLIPTAKKAIIWRTKHDKRTFVKEVDFKTTRGNLWKIVTPLCVFVYKNGQLQLDSIHPHTTIEEVQENTAFPLIYDHITYTELPTKAQLQKLKIIDPYDYRSVEF